MFKGNPKINIKQLRHNAPLAWTFAWTFYPHSLFINIWLWKFSLTQLLPIKCLSILPFLNQFNFRSKQSCVIYIFYFRNITLPPVGKSASFHTPVLCGFHCCCPAHSNRRNPRLSSPSQLQHCCPSRLLVLCIAEIHTFCQCVSILFLCVSGEHFDLISLVHRCKHLRCQCFVP